MAPPSPRSTFDMIMEPQDQNQEGRQESLTMMMASSQDQNQEGREAHVVDVDQQQNIDVAEPQLEVHDDQEARQILQQAAGRASGESHALRVYRGNWRGAQERSMLRKMIEDLRMKDALDRLNESPDVNVRMVQQQQHQHYQALMRSSLMGPPPLINRLILPAPPAPPAFMPAAYAMNQYHPAGDHTSSYPFMINHAETMEGNNSSSTTSTVLMTRDLLSNFGKNHNSNETDHAVLPPVEEDADNTLAGGLNSEHGESSAGPGRELREIDFFGISNRSGGDGNNGVDLNLGL